MYRKFLNLFRSMDFGIHTICYYIPVKNVRFAECKDIKKQTA